MLFSNLRVALARWRARRHQLVRLEHAVLALPEVDRRVYLLCATARLPQDVVAERLGLTTAQVQQHLARALYALVIALADSNEPMVAPDDGSR